jgi:hypothetical protein
MGRSSNIFWGFATFGLGVFNAYLQWSLIESSSGTLSQMHLFNAAVWPFLALQGLGQALKWLSAPSSAQVLDAHRMLILSESRLVRAARLCSGLLMVGTSIWWLFEGGYFHLPVQRPPLLALFVSAMGALTVASVGLRPRWRLSLTQEGLTSSQLRPAQLAWDEVVAVTRTSFWFGSRITLMLRETRTWRSSALLARWRRVDKINFNPDFFGVEFDALLKGIELRRSVFTF